MRRPGAGGALSTANLVYLSHIVHGLFYRDGLKGGLSKTGLPFSPSPHKSVCTVEN